MCVVTSGEAGSRATYKPAPATVLCGIFYPVCSVPLPLAPWLSSSISGSCVRLLACTFAVVLVVAAAAVNVLVLFCCFCFCFTESHVPQAGFKIRVAKDYSERTPSAAISQVLGLEA